jgi:hypothetical protein
MVQKNWDGLTFISKNSNNVRWQLLRWRRFAWAFSAGVRRGDARENLKCRSHINRHIVYVRGGCHILNRCRLLRRRTQARSVRTNAGCTYKGVLGAGVLNAGALGAGALGAGALGAGALGAGALGAGALVACASVCGVSCRAKKKYKP